MTQLRKQHPVLIFDFGNVVAFFDYRKACDLLGRPLGLSGEALLELARARNFVAILQQYERGAITAEAFSESFCRLVGLELPHHEFAAAWSDIFWLNEPMARLVEFLKQEGYRLILGSNTNALHAARFQKQFASTLAHFDHLVLSHEVGHLKPSAEFYLACASAAGQAPASCVFIDDLAENVEGARAAGLSALQFTEFPKLLSDLMEAGVDVSPLLEQPLRLKLTPCTILTVITIAPTSSVSTSPDGVDMARVGQIDLDLARELCFGRSVQGDRPVKIQAAPLSIRHETKCWDGVKSRGVSQISITHLRIPPAFISLV